MNFIELDSVTKTTKKRNLLNQVSFKIQKGEIVTLEGINGSGKTLILKAILGLIHTSGQISVANSRVRVEDKYPIEAGILIENPSLIEGFNAFQNLELLAKLQPRIERYEIYDLLRIFHLDKAGNEKVRKFSLGMKQKLGIAQALLGQNELIVLDEPTNALDKGSIADLITIIKEINESGSTFIIATHDCKFIDEISTRRLYVKDGEVYDEEQ
ncbi:ATP-binding cassette domain-containing protein [Companilactobacillus mishanensis]|uniref:ATP-binding cassette domain-containing protein n=1 Tax=Companilactobacillus mishanensis TaxID=2486008 RepID=UPI0012958090|nr:ABC transporter ATP-binding protein [Companilactobacillus mishanensis]MQS89029.1 ABC transporter ATP-binding protein [Companilactobacillus mishanensis]